MPGIKSEILDIMINTEDLKTSAEWEDLCIVKILDPDGWDRKNFEQSWFKEKITRKEFERRLTISTIVPIEGYNYKNFWKDR